ncbi:hypothetical protein [Streptomyces sp. CC224B]|uniref:DUF6197 family protein n=1 Tax=Streptomyces sp. CC224B TaxID=3044571 RepID=UPI0024A85BAA|nr:hypothetical protein [Streptomyces sp. CC224B]
MATSTPSPTPAVYSPVAEAERVARLESARRLLATPCYWLTVQSLDADSASAARQLDAVSVLLVREGWVQWEPRSESGFCLMGALECVTAPGASFISTAYRVLSLMVHVRTGMQGSGIAAWNDAAGRAVGEVLELIEDAAELARGWKAVAS